MTNNKDIRWEQRFSNFKKALMKLSDTYNQETANEILLKIMNEYFFAFVKFQEVMEGKRTE
jgi:hypothetical protein